MNKFKYLIILGIVATFTFAGCGKDKKAETLAPELEASETVEGTAAEDVEESSDVVEETPYLVKNYDTDEILGYLEEDDKLVVKVIDDVTAFYKADTSMKPDTVEQILNDLVKNGQVTTEIYTEDYIKETINEYKEQNIQEDFYNLDIKQLRFNEDKSIVTVVATVSFLDTTMNLKIFDCESAFEFNKEKSVWKFCGLYSTNEIQ